MINLFKIFSSSKYWLGICALIMLGIQVPTLSMAQANATIYGAWSTHEGGEVTFYDCGDYLCGDITSLRPPDADTPTTDIYNPDPTLRDRPLLGLQMFSGLEADSDGKWSGGKLYNTMEGKKYKAKLKLEDDGTLTMSGCMMFFCKSFAWTKIDPDDDDKTIDEASNE